MRCSLKAIDEMVGDIVEELGPEAENTVIIFTSDNGYLFGEHRWFYKLCEFEECIRVPLIIKYPALIPPGVKTDQIVQRLDLRRQRIRRYAHRRRGDDLKTVLIYLGRIHFDLIGNDDNLFLSKNTSCRDLTGNRNMLANIRLINNIAGNQNQISRHQ